MNRSCETFSAKKFAIKVLRSSVFIKMSILVSVDGIPGCDKQRIVYHTAKNLKSDAVLYENYFVGNTAMRQFFIDPMCDRVLLGFPTELAVISSLMVSLDTLLKYVSTEDKIFYDHTIFWPFLWIKMFHERGYITDLEYGVLLQALDIAVKRFIDILKDNHCFYLLIILDCDPALNSIHCRHVKKLTLGGDFFTMSPMTTFSERFLLDLNEQIPAFLHYVHSKFSDYKYYSVIRVANHKNGVFENFDVTAEHISTVTRNTLSFIQLAGPKITNNESLICDQNNSEEDNSFEDLFPFK